MGCYEEANGFAGGAVTWWVGYANYSIPAGGTDYNWGGTCPAGMVLIGGGAFTSNAHLVVSARSPTGSPQYWRETYKNTGTAACTVTTYSRCMDIR